MGESPRGIPPPPPPLPIALVSRWHVFHLEITRYVVLN